ncbi:MAG TPA: hypothetical protein VNE82_03430 [Candidatus Binataceae bacterium]|nr:hypothetical protein [Candidatus Binataceae bacterium]
MAFTLFRVDAIYSVPFTSPALTVVGNIPDLLGKAYRLFADRYPGVPVSAFKALNSNTLSEVGIAISLLDARLEITLRVDQFTVQATELRTPEETRLAQDCVLLMQDFVDKTLDPSAGTVSLRIASWLLVNGGKAQILKNLRKISKPQSTTFNPKQIGAEKMESFTKVNFQNETAGWQLSVLAEPAAIPDADLYLYRDYQFLPGGELDSSEKKLGFLEMSSLAVYEWLGIGMLKQE